MSSELVREFHTIFKAPIRDEPNLDVAENGLRYELIREELEELGEAYEASNLVEIADALGDIVYVAHGAALTFGISDVVDGALDFLNRKELTIDAEKNKLMSEGGRNSMKRTVEGAFITKLPEFSAGVLAGLIHSCYEMARSLDIPLDDVIAAIHKSNMTKLGEDGKPIFRESDGKVLKGPNYQTPTADIKKLLGVEDVEVA